ncbi:beta-galactosidase [Demequina litorisediminis]|uniref:Glycoside hydrolase 35 catalytic domain-containing protein n=1 Tax=Demequina litorisediminis TaxID=1849022 RepID=A0ABQ6ID91_9MICO|nr:beta-galactosidase [Demequina litorisediminis]GMA35817.1 hypothetical protein GCM10025876_20210 [Demequina litorisediminis]
MATDAPRPAMTPAHTITLDTPEAPRRGHLPMGEHAGTADRIEITSRSVERGGDPTFPITGEIHYSRLPRERWDDALAHAKAGGLTSVATYVLWQAHEPSPGDFRWDGNLDLRAFVTLAGQHGLDVVVRMGPWAHGEARNGGFPDWLLALPLTPRTDDPAYLDLVRRLYGAIVAQLEGLAHAEGGPIIAAQMDNEALRPARAPRHAASHRRGGGPRRPPVDRHGVGWSAGAGHAAARLQRLRGRVLGGRAHRLAVLRPRALPLLDGAG